MENFNEEKEEAVMAEQYEEFRIEYDYEWLRNRDRTTWTSPTRSEEDAYTWLYQYFQGNMPNIHRVQRRTVVIGDWEDQ
jgi:hypothetical protein